MSTRREKRPDLRIARSAGGGQGDRKNTDAQDRIIACAGEILGLEGYGALTVSAVCKRADVSAPTLYWHFGNKEGLLAALLKQTLREDADAFLSVDTTGLQPHEVFDLYLIALRKIVVTDRPNNWVILSSLSEARHTAPEIVAIIAEARRRQIEYNAEQLRSWGMRNDRVIVHLWLAYCNYISLLYQDSKSEELVDEAISSFRQLYFLTLGALGECCAQEPSFQDMLKQAGYDPAASRPDERSSEADAANCDRANHGGTE